LGEANPHILLMPEAKNRKLCAICGKPVDEVFKPFCSKRCADVDLGRWLKGSYAIPAREPGETEVDEGGEGEA